MPFKVQETPCPTKYGFEPIRLDWEPEFKPRNLEKEFLKVWIWHVMDQEKENPFI